MKATETTIQPLSSSHPEVLDFNLIDYLINIPPSDSVLAVPGSVWFLLGDTWTSRSSLLNPQQASLQNPFLYWKDRLRDVGLIILSHSFISSTFILTESLLLLSEVFLTFVEIFVLFSMPLQNVFPTCLKTSNALELLLYLEETVSFLKTGRSFPQRCMPRA